MKTMKIMRRMMSLATALLALSACSESEDLLAAYHSDSKAVHITAQVGKASADGFTRSNPLGDAEKQKEFNENDEISVKADGQEAVTYQFNGSEWLPKESSKFLKWESNEMNFTAYYPASFDGNLNNVTPPEKYDEASLAANDFMSYSGKQSNTNGNNLTLTMERKMARVVVEIADFNDQYDQKTSVNSVTIHTSKGEVKAYKHSDGKFYALMVPCEADTNAKFLKLSVGEGNAEETMTGVPALEAGKSYTYQLTVGKNKISVSGITVANWTSGEIPGGKAEYKAKTPYITFTAEEGQIFKMITESSSNGPYGENEPYEITGLEYSVNNKDVWKKVVKNEEVTFGGTNGTLRLRGKNIAGTAKDDWNYATITFEKAGVKVTCTGDIRTLLDYESYKTVKTDQARFRSLFYNCKAMTSAPDLPAETLADKCYSSMFYGCTSLKTAPKLPATTLARFCYYSMFSGCTALETAPELPAEALTSCCYGYMFDGCTSLETAPELRATQLFSSCYEGMFRGCSLESAPELPATKLAIKCYAYMFQDCANLSSVTILASSDQIKNYYNTCLSWLDGAGTSAKSRKLIVLDEAAYNALETNSDYLSAKWKKGATNTTVEYYTPKP